MLTLQILHASDLEGGVDAIDDAPAFGALVDFFEAEAAADGIASILLSAGDNYIPGPFFNAAGLPELQDDLQAAVESFFGLEAGSLPGIEDGVGRIDVTIANILGLDASALGNHEFDAGPATLGAIISAAFADTEGAPTLADISWLGAQFPYLSANLDFSAEAALAGLFTDEILLSTGFGQTPDAFVATGATPQIAPSTLIEVEGEDGTELVGVIGATTQLLATISSEGNVEVISGGSNDMAALAAILQPQVDALIAAGTNKVVLVSHLQQFALEQELATLLNGVDVIVAGGSDTIVADADDALRPGDEIDVEGYPFIATGADGNPVAIVSTDGQYSYLGRLVVTFDADGVIVPESIDSAVSGPFATDEAGVTAVTGAATVGEAIAASEKGSAIATLTDALRSVVEDLAATAPGFSSVYLDGRRDKVRTEETNLGNLTADANLAAARAVDATVTVSLKNGGGIRDDIGDIILDNDGNPSFEAPFGNAVSELDIQNALRFNNTLGLFTTDAAGLKILLEHGVAASEPGATPGRFPQLGGIAFSFDPEGTAQELDDQGNVTVAGTRVQSIAILDDNGDIAQVIVRDGAVVEGAPSAIRVVTLNFLLGDEGELVGGDGYPFRAVATDIAFLTDDGGLTTDPDAENLLGEQQALSEYLAAEFGTAETAFGAAETGPDADFRIQNLSVREDGIAGPATGPGGPNSLNGTLVASFQGDSDPQNEDSPEGASEVVSVDGGILYVTNGNLDRIDLFSLADGEQTGSIDLSFIDGFGGVTSVAAGGGIVVAVADREPLEDGTPVSGVAAIFDADTLELVTTVSVGNLPDSVAISPDGTVIAIANEGEFNAESSVTADAPGSVTLIDVSDLAAPVVTTVGFDGVDATGLRITPGIDPALNIEPEYTAFSPDGTRVFVTLQEANGVAVIDVATGTVADILPLGFLDHSLPQNAMDTTDDDVIDILPRNTLGIRMPDAIGVFEVGGALFFATANEGDSRGDFEDGGDEARVGDLIELGLIDPSVDTAGLERLTVSTINGDTDGDGDIDVLHSFGSRSFTIYDEAGTVVFDSGSQFERATAALVPFRFNDDGGDGGQNRSDAKGPEPEALAVGEVDGTLYAFIGMERDSGVFIYDISTPSEAKFVSYIDGFATGNIGPETIEFIPASESTTGNAQIAVAYEISGTTAVFDLTPGDPAASRPVEVVDVTLLYEGALDRIPDDPGLNFWIDIAQNVLTVEEVAQFFVDSPEFNENFDTSSDEAFINTLYENVLEREADQDGLDFWTAVIGDVGQGGALLSFVRSNENPDANLDALIETESGDWVFIG